MTNTERRELCRSILLNQPLHNPAKVQHNLHQRPTGLCPEFECLGYGPRTTPTAMNNYGVRLMGDWLS